MKTDKDYVHIQQLLSLVNPQLIEEIESMLGLFDKRIGEFIVTLLKAQDISHSQIGSLLLENNLSKLEFSKIVSFIEKMVYSSLSTSSDFYSKILSLDTKKIPENTYTYFRNKAIKSIDDEQITYPDLYLMQYQIDYYEIIQDFDKSKHQNVYLSQDILAYFIYKQVALLNYYITETQIYNSNIQSIIQEVEKVNKLAEIYEIESVEITIFLKLNNLLLYNELTDYEYMLNILDSNQLRLKSYTINSFYLALINSLFINQKRWNKELSEVLNIYELMYEKNRTIFYEYLNPQVIKNIATLCIRYNRREWYLSLFNESVSKSLSQLNKNALKLCEAKFLFHSKEYNKCIEHLMYQKSNDIFQELELRRLQIMCFYELQERVLVDNYLNTFKVFIHRNDIINKVYKESNNNFMRFLNRINKSVDIKKTENILAEIQQTERVAEKQWILDSANNLIQKLVVKSKS